MKEETSSQTSVVRLHFREDIREPSSKPSLPVLTPRRDVLGLPRARRAVAWIWGILPSLPALPEPDPRGSPPPHAVPAAPSPPASSPGAFLPVPRTWRCLPWRLAAVVLPTSSVAPSFRHQDPPKRRNALDCLVGKLSQEPTQWSRQLVDSS